MNQIIIILIFISTTCSFTIQRTKKQEEQSQPSRFRKFITGEAVPHLPQLNRIPAISKSKSLVVPSNTEFNPCSTSNNLCLNNGKCVNRDGMFTCYCPTTHYGKRCEKLADMKNCFANKCKNNSVCVSRLFPKEIVSQSNKSETAAERNTNLTEKVNYDCLCPEGFLGSFCEISEAEMDCRENYCMSHGTGTLLGQNCTCDCHSNYIGNRCEMENPCSSITCFNSGKCEYEIDESQQRIEAVCKCPKTELVSTRITGEFCENISVSDVYLYSEAIPCGSGGARKKFEEYVLPRLTSFEDRRFFSSMLQQCRTELDENCSHHPSLSTGWCLGKNALCEPRVVKFPSEAHYLVPYCVCSGADTGILCQYHREDVCDPTLEDRANGITRENRCTNIDQGVCIDILGDLKCDCRRGFVGEACETYNPCVNKPCGEAECVAIPSEIVVNRPGQYKELYRCLCDMDSDRSDGSTCVFSGTGNCTSHDLCHNGLCITCETTDENDVLQLCSDQQLNDGFRCVCKPGYQPPYCQDIQDPCFEHLCANGGRCRKISKYDYECLCNPGTDGTLCERIIDYCSAYGSLQCINGNCKEDRSSLRGFICSCDYSYYGKNCELKMRSHEAVFDMIMSYYWFTLPILSIFVTCVILMLAYMCCSSKDQVCLQVVLHLIDYSLFTTLTEIEKISADDEPPISGVFDDEAHITDSVSAAVTPICSDPEEEDPHVLPLKRAGEPILTASKRLKSSSLSTAEYMNTESANILLSMGFSEEQVPIALALAEGDLEKAVLYLTGEVPGIEDYLNSSVPENSHMSNGCVLREEYGGSQRMPLSALQIVQNYIYQGRALHYKLDNPVDKCLKAAIQMCQEDVNIIDEKLDDFIINCLPEIVVRHSSSTDELRFDSEMLENYYNCIDLSVTLIVLSLTRPQCTAVVCRSMCDILNNEQKSSKYSKRREATTHLKILMASSNIYTDTDKFSSTGSYPLYRLQESIEQFCQDDGFNLLSKLISSYTKSAESLENMLACIQLTNVMLPYMQKELFVVPTSNWMDKGLDTIETLTEKDIRSSFTRSFVLELLDELNRLSYNIPSTEHNGENGRLDITRLEFILKCLKCSQFEARMFALNDLCMLSLSVKENNAIVGEELLNEWLKVNKVLNAVLSGNLDMAAYVEKTNKLLAYMAPILSTSDLIYVWSLRNGRLGVSPERFQSIVAHIAAQFSLEQMVFMCDLFEKAFKTGEQRTFEKVFNICADVTHTCDNEDVVKMIIYQMWDYILIAKSFHYDVSHALDIHAEMISFTKKLDYRDEFVKRSLMVLLKQKDSDKNVLPILFVVYIRNVLALGVKENLGHSSMVTRKSSALRAENSAWGDSACEAVRRQELKELLNDNNLFHHVVRNITNCQRIAYNKSLELQDFVIPGENSRSCFESDDVSDPVNMDVADGYTYMNVLQFSLKLITWMFEHRVVEFSFEKIQSLWLALVASETATSQEKTEFFHFLTRLHKEVIGQNTFLHLLSKFSQLKPDKYTVDGVRAFFDIYHRVSHGPHCLNTEEIKKHWACVWEILENVNDAAVVDHVITKIVKEGVYGDRASAAPRPFVKFCMNRLNYLMEEYDRSRSIFGVGDNSNSLQKVHRNLCVLTKFTSVNESCFMYVRSEPLHGTLIPGRPIRVDMYCEGYDIDQKALSVSTHTNEVLAHFKTRLDQRLGYYGIENYTMHVDWGEDDDREISMRHPWKTLEQVAIVPSNEEVLYSNYGFLRVRLFLRNINNLRPLQRTSFETNRSLEEELPSSLLQEHRSLYSILFELPIEQNKKIITVRRQLFNILPNDPSVDAAFQVHVKHGIDKLSSNNNQQQYLFKNIDEVKSVFSLDAPYKFLYGLEVLCGKLMPTSYSVSTADGSCNMVSALRNSDVVEFIIGKIEYIADNFKDYNINDDPLYLDIIEKANTLLRHFLLNIFYMKESSQEDVEVFNLLESANPELPSTSKTKKDVIRNISNTFSASLPTLQNWDIDKITHFSKIWIKLISVVRSNNNHLLGNLTERGVDRFGDECDKDVFSVEQALYATKKLLTGSQRVSYLRSKISVDCLRLMLEIFQQFVDSNTELLYYELLSKFVFDETWRNFAKAILLDGKDNLLRHVGCFYLVSIIKKCTTGTAALCLTCLYELVLPILNDDRPSSALDSHELTQRTNILDVMQTISSILVNTSLGDDDDVELWSCAVDGILNLVLPLTKKIVSTKVDRNYESADSALVSALMETVRGLVASGNLGEKITKEVGEFIITKLVNGKLFPGYSVDGDNFSGQSSISPPSRWNDFGIRKQAVSLLLELAATNRGSNAILLLEKLNMRFESESISGWEFEPDVEEKQYNRVGLKNDGGTCYMNSILQQIFAINPIAQKFVSLDVSSDTSWECGLRSDLLVELQRVFGHLYFLLEKVYIPRGVWNAFRFSGDDHLDTKKQHDAIDFLTELVDKCDTIMEKLESPLLFKPQLAGKFAYEYICYECYTRHQGPEEEYLTVNLELHGTTLEDSLQHYVDGEILEGENAYHCRECNSKRTTLRRGSFYTLPNTLSIQLKRFTFDYTGRQAQKNNEYCKFPEFLDMNPYMKHSQTYDAKDIDMLFEEIHSTQKLGSTTKSNTTTPHPSPSSPMKMRRRRRISTLPTQQVNPEDYHYELVGVLAHSGLAAAGHYFSFVKDQDADSKKSSWYELNDSQVKPFDVENDAENTWYGGHFRAKNVNNLPEERTRTWNAYVLFYQKKPVSGFCSSLISETKKLIHNESEVFHSMPSWLQIEIVNKNTRFIKERDLFSDEYRDLMLEAASQFFTSMCQLLPDEEVEYKENMCLYALKYILSFCSRIVWRLSSMFRCSNVLMKSQKVLRQLLSTTPNVRKRFLLVLAEDNYKIFDEMSLCPNLEVFKSFFENVSDILSTCIGQETNVYTHNKESVFIRKSLSLLKNEFYHSLDNAEVITEMLRRVSYHSGGMKILWELEASSFLCDLVVSCYDGDNMMKLRVPERDLRHERMRSVPELFLDVLHYGIFQNDQIDDSKLALTKMSVHFFITWIYCGFTDNNYLRERIVKILAESDNKLGAGFTALRINALLNWLTVQSISIPAWGAVVSLIVSTVLMREKSGHEDSGRALLLFLDEQELAAAEDSTLHTGVIPWLEHMISKGAFKLCHDMHRALEVLYNCKASSIIQFIMSTRLQRLKIIGQRIDECAYDSQSLVYDHQTVSHKARDFMMDGGSSTILGITEMDSITIPSNQDIINIEHDHAPNAFTATALVTSSSEDIDFKKIM